MPLALILAILAILASIFISGIGFYKSLFMTYTISALAVHYIIYEHRAKGEYYFYYNLGFNKWMLWVATLVLSTVISFLFLSVLILFDYV